MRYSLTIFHPNLILLLEVILDLQLGLIHMCGYTAVE